MGSLGARLFPIVLTAVAACGTATSSTSAGGTSGGERPRPTGTAIAARPAPAPDTTPSRTLSRDEFEAQWATGAPPPAPGLPVGAPPGTGGGPYAAYGGLGYDIEHPIGVCGTGESYLTVASHVCPDGSRPLGGDAGRGASARVGNVGASSTGHIIDLYEVPCPTGAVQLYIDMYACPGGGSPF